MKVFVAVPFGNWIFRRDLSPFLRRFSIAAWRGDQIVMSDIASSFKRGKRFSTFRSFGGCLDAFFSDDGFFGLGGSSRGQRLTRSYNIEERNRFELGEHRREVMCGEER